MNHKSAWWFMLPSLLILAVFTVYPALLSVWMSFHESDPFAGNLLSGMEWVGWSHYQELITSPEYWASLNVTFKFALLTVPLSVIFSLILALGLQSRPFFQNTLRGLFLSPVGVSPAMAGMLWVFIYNPTAGYLNLMLQKFGWTGPGWLTDPEWALPAVAIATVWKETGFNVIFFLAGLAAVPLDLYEAATVDGASKYRQFWSVTLPMISPTLFFVVTVSVIHAFESFGQIHVLTRGGPANATAVLVYSLYRDAFANLRTGFASAQAVVLFLIILILTLIQVAAARRRVHYQ